MVKDEVITKLCDESRSGVLAKVLSSDGLGPTQQGDALFWSEGRRVVGTVGGGENEQQVLEACAALDKKQKIVEIKPASPAILPSCGGTLQVRLDRLDLSLEEDQKYFRAQLQRKDSGRLLLFGAGHVVQELVWLADRTGFSSVIIDPRQSLLEAADLPQTVSCVCSAATEWLDRGVVGTADYIIIAGPDHATDLAVLQKAAGTAAHYIGVMGSSRKIESFVTLLRKEGVYPSLERRLYAPIGMDIPSKRPAEVAVSIVAQLIAVRAGQSST